MTSRRPLPLSANGFDTSDVVMPYVYGRLPLGIYVAYSGDERNLTNSPNFPGIDATPVSHTSCAANVVVFKHDDRNDLRITAVHVAIYASRIVGAFICDIKFLCKIRQSSVLFLMGRSFS